jgi:hypothetical protein
MTLPSAYNSNIPQATDQISVSQGQLLLNFQSIQALIDINHVDFAAANAGKHFFIEFPGQASSPTITAAEVGLFCVATSPYTAQPELAFLKQAGATVPAPLTTAYEFTSAGYASPGWTRLPSGILLKWGGTSADGATTITFPAAGTIPAFQAIYSMQITTFSGLSTDVDEFARLISFNTTSFIVYGSARTTISDATAGFQYLAIGV